MPLNCSDTLSRLKGIETLPQGQSLQLRAELRSDTLSRLKGIETPQFEQVINRGFCSDTLSRLKGIETPVFQH